MSTTRIWRQPSELVGWKLCVCAFLGVVLSAACCIVVLIQGPLAGLLLLVVLPLVAALSNALMAFVEHRYARHVTYAVVNAVGNLLPLGCFVENVTRDEVSIFLAIYVPINFALAMLGSVAGIAVVRCFYAIVVGPTDACDYCGYSLKGLPTNRCPECGHDFDPKEKNVTPV